MNEFLSRIILSNRVQDWLVTAGILMLVWVFKNYLSKKLANGITRLIKIEDKPSDKDHLHRLVLTPMRLFLIVLVIIVAFNRLQFPALFNFDFYRINSRAVIEGLTKGILIGAFFWLCSRFIRYAAFILQRKALETTDRFDDQLVIFFRDFFKVIIWVLGALMILKYAFGYPLSHVFTALGIVGAALALAFRESLENLIASFIIFFDNPFTVGDLVKVENVTGTIEKIGLRSTRIRTLEKTFTTVPNKKMVDTIVDNLTLRLQRNVVTRLELGLEATSAQIKALVAEIDGYLDSLEHVLDWNVYLSDTGQAAHIVHVEYFVNNDLEVKLFFKLRENVNLQLLDMVAQHRLDLAAANTRIVIAKQD